MITLTELIEATTWLKPEDHMKVVLWNKSRIYEKEEFENIELNVYNLAKYGNYLVSDIDIEEYDDGSFLGCLIRKD